MAAESSLKGPGFGLPFDVMPKWERRGERSRFPHAIADFMPSEDVTKRGQTMLEFVNQITDKRRWTEKIQDEKIVEKWRQEAFHIYDVLSTVVKADLPEGDNGKVPLLDCSEWIGCGEACPAPDLVENNADYERDLTLFQVELKPWGSFQWLPADVRLTKDGAKIESYVNNLHLERHRDLYAVLEIAVDKAPPLWNEYLSWFQNRLRIRIPGCHGLGFDDYWNPELTMADIEKSGDKPEAAIQDDTRRDENGSDMDSEFYDNPGEPWLRRIPNKREIFQPNPTRPFVPFEDQLRNDNLAPVSLSEDFPDGIQVIFKLANIHLTPDKPRYEGSSWHVEGALNEHICATALFYYDQENIEDSFLEFRQEVDPEDMVEKTQQFEWMAAEDLFGIKQDGPAQQDLGKILTRKRRMLAFPNVMQHRVRPFGLADPSKPGFRKILAMFLVDPHIRILSTSNVPPQRKDWWADEVRKIDPFAGLPVELFDRIIADVEDFPIGWKEACELRKVLMAERGRARDEFEEALARDTFYFCEH